MAAPRCPQDHRCGQAAHADLRRALAPDTPQVPNTLDESTSLVECQRCGGAMRSATVKTTIWIEDRPYLVEDIPAQVCDSCAEQFYDAETTEALRRLTEDGFAHVKPDRELLVPVFSLAGRIPQSSLPDEEGEAEPDYLFGGDY